MDIIKYKIIRIEYIIKYTLKLKPSLYNLKFKRVLDIKLMHLIQTFIIICINYKWMKLDLKINHLIIFE